MMRRAALLLALLAAAGCASKAPTEVGELSMPYQQQQAKGETGARAQVHTELAGAYYSTGQYAIALEEANKALQADSSYVPAHNMLGLTYMRLGQNSFAQQSFDRAVSLNPNDSDTRNNYGWFLCQTRREDEAIKQFQLALRNPLYQTPEKAWLNSGLCARNKGDVEAAAGYFQKALQLQPALGPALVGLADLAFRRGEYREARAYLERHQESNAPTPESLWLTVRVARKLGDREAEAQAGLQLRRRYPDSNEARAYASGKYE